MISTEPRVHSQIHEYQAKQRRGRLWHKIVSALACVVVFCTTYALILPAITMETPRILDCPLVVHTHTEDCYDEEGVLVCGQADFVVHTHDRSCYDADGNLACLIPEMEAHEHTDECYAVEKLLICNLEEWKGPAEPEEPETPGETVVHEHDESCYAAERGALFCENEDEDHEHTDECYEWVPILTCALEESAGHEHTEDCYTEETAVLCGLEETAGHRHDESCYTAGQGELICGSEDEEHEHTDECYEQIPVLSCGMEEGEGAHAHTEECYGQISTLTCGLEEGEGAHTHSTDCRLLICGLEEGERVPVDTDTAQAVPTGEMVLSEEGDAEAAPTSEKVLDVGDDAEAAPTSERVPGHIHTDECYEIKRTLTCEEKELLLHTHTDDCYDGDGNWICGQLEILEHVHTDECFRIVEEEVFAGPYVYEDDSVAVEVTLAEGSTVPEGATLVVRPITGMTAFSADDEDGGSDYDYETLVRQAEEAVDKEVTEIVLFDISFYTLEGEYLPVADTATVSLRFKEAVLAGDTGEVAVLHYQEDADLPVALESVDVERDEDDAVSTLTFQTEGFSVFAVVTVTDGDYKQVTDVKDLDGKSVAILSNSGKYAMTATTITGGFQADAVSVADLSGYNIWTFTKNSDGTYYISSNGNYLVVGAGTLSSTTDKAKASAFAIKITNGLAEIGADVNGTPYYINLNGGEYANNGGFKSYQTSANNLQQLYIEVDQTGDGTPLTDLGGKSFVIANLNTAARQYAMISTHSTKDTRLSAVPVSVVEAGTEEDKTTYVTGDGLTTWTFTATGTPGVYYIKADDTGEYLSLTGGALTTSDTAQEITVATSSTYPGQVRLSANSMAVDWHGGSNPNNLVFGPYNGTNQNDYQTLCQPLDAAPGTLFYDLNSPFIYGAAIAWQTPMPNIESIYQEIKADDADAKLYAKPANFSEEAGVAGIPGLYRFDVIMVDDIGDSPAYTNGRMGDTWYGEQRFDGWTYTAEDGTTYLFDPEAAITIDEKGEMTVIATRKVISGSDGDTIENIDKIPVILPGGAELRGHWTEVSNVVTFFVNYKGTILDTEGDVRDRRTDTFTKAVAVGHVFYGKLTVGDDQMFGSGANAQITSAIAADFTQQFNPDNPDTQIVIEYLRECTVPLHGDIEDPDKGPQEGTNYTTSMRLDTPGANNTAVVANTLLLLKRTGRTIQVATGNGTNPVIDNSLCDEDHYEVRWYVMKEQTNTWHIDGVLVAKTSEISVTKTFSGITTDQAATLLAGTGKDGRFQIDTQLGVDNEEAGTIAQDYLKITTDSVAGQYTYRGSDVTAGLPNSYHWTFHAITDETYTMTEQNYGLSGYDVSSIIVHYYNNPKTGLPQIEYVYGDSTENDEFGNPVTGGDTTSISFNNFYTPTGTGAMAIVKRDSTTSANDTFGLLQGAEFTLYQEEACTNIAKDSKGNKLVVTTNPNGTAYFSGMNPGIYYLKETKAPDGYALNNGVWQVQAGKNANGTVTVKLYEKNGDSWNGTESATLYDGGIQDSYTVKDVADTTTITVIKTFEDLTSDELADLVADSKAVQNGFPSGYYIRLQGNIGSAGDVDADKKTDIILTLDQAQPRQDGSFVWTIHDLAVTRSVTNDDGTTTQSPIQYTITEHNYMLDNYVDTVVTAKMTVPVSGGYETEDVPEVKDPYKLGNITGPYLYIDRGVTSAQTVAYIERVTFNADRSDIVRLNNRYTNTFDLRLRKIDSGTKEPLANAEFKIYGPFGDIPAGTPTTPYTYTDENGNQQTVYYLKTITSGRDGYAVLADLRLSQGVNTFVYILDESTAPDGYTAAEPQVVTVTVDGGVINTPSGSDYLAGVLEYSAPNTKEEDYVHTELTTKKVWEPYDPPDGAQVTLELYRVTHEKRNTPLDDVVDAVLVKSCILDGKAEEKPGTPDNWNENTPSKDKIQVYESSPWVATWMNLYSASRDYSEDNPDHYHYFVREVFEIDGRTYTTTYVVKDKDDVEVIDSPAVEDRPSQQLKLQDGKIITAYLLADMDEAYTVTITNTEHFTLPATGGAGALPYAMGGTLLMAGCLLYGYKLRRKWERRSAR